MIVMIHFIHFIKDVYTVEIINLYFVICFAQTKITLFIFVNNWVIRENERFLLVERSSRVTCCVQKKLQYFFRKYIFICAICNLLMQLRQFSMTLLSSWWHQLLEKTYGLLDQHGAMVSDSFAYRNIKSYRQHSLYVLRSIF